MSSLLIIVLDMSGVIRALGSIFTLSKLHPVVFIAAHTPKKKKKLKLTEINYIILLCVDTLVMIQNINFLML